MENRKYTFPLSNLTYFLKVILLLTALCTLISCAKNETYESSPKNVFASKKNQMLMSEEARKITDYMRASELNGSVLFSKNGNPIYKGGYGLSDFQKKIKNTEETKFPVASLTKMTVAVSVLQLQEKKQLDLNDCIGKYITDFPNGKRIKLIHLLTNTSGISAPFWSEGMRSPMNIVNAIKGRPIKFRAGARWDYQDSNYILLGHVIEKVSGISLHEYIKKNIFSIANMKNSGFITRNKPFPYDAKGYLKINNQYKSFQKSNIHLLLGAGDMYSTVEDINKLDEAVMACKLFSVKSRDAMLLPRSNSHYGLGVYSYGDYFFSRGTLGGWNAVHVYFKDKTNVVLLLNVRNQQLDILKHAKNIRKLLLK